MINALYAHNCQSHIRLNSARSQDLHFGSPVCVRYPSAWGLSFCLPSVCAFTGSWISSRTRIPSNALWQGMRISQGWLNLLLPSTIETLRLTWIFKLHLIPNLEHKGHEFNRGKCFMDLRLQKYSISLMVWNSQTLKCLGLKPSFSCGRKFMFCVVNSTV